MKQSMDDEENSATALAHPEEMRTSFKLRLGNNVILRGTARTTPAGLVSAGIAISSIILAVAALVWAARRRPL
jgi:hypothetical protein